MPLSKEQMELLINRSFEMALQGVPLKEAQAAVRRELGLDKEECKDPPAKFPGAKFVEREEE